MCEESRVFLGKLDSYAETGQRFPHTKTSRCFTPHGGRQWERTSSANKGRSNPYVRAVASGRPHLDRAILPFLCRLTAGVCRLAGCQRTSILHDLPGHFTRQADSGSANKRGIALGAEGVAGKRRRGRGAPVHHVSRHASHWRRAEDNSALSDVAIRERSTFIRPRHHFSALTWTFYLLGCHPEVEQSVILSLILFLVP